MSTIIALFQIIPIAISALCILALSGVFAGWLLAHLSDRISKIILRVLLISAAVVPAVIYHGSNYWMAIRRNPHPMALNPIPLNHESLEILYFLWWCVTAIFLWAALIWRKRLAA
jgi:glucan phosphoethanolaminetransferase (alkaline phosphatase superfamily)